MKIDEIELTDQQVLRVVNKWYTNGMYPDILQNESGYDLEEIIEREMDGFPIRDEYELEVELVGILKRSEKEGCKSFYTRDGLAADDMCESCGAKRDKH